MLFSSLSTLRKNKLSQKTVLHIASWFPHTGDAQNGIFIEKHMSLAQNVSNSYFLLFPPRGEKCIVSNLKDKRFCCISGNKFGKLIRLSIAIFSLLFKVKHIDFVHLHVCSEKSKFALKLAALFNAQLIITEHWTGYRNGNFDKLPNSQKKLRTKALSEAYKVSCVSAALIEDLQNIVLRQYEILPNEIAQGTLKNSFSETIRILSVSDLNDKNKNISGILNTFLKFLENYPKAEWHLVGDGENKNEILELIESTGLLNKNIFYLGRKSHEEVLSLYGNYSFLCQFSRFETFSMVPAEAILCGIPVVASKCGGPEFYIKPDGGILIESENEQQLLNAMVELSNNSNKYSLAQTQNFIKNHYSKSAIEKKLVELYN